MHEVSDKRIVTGGIKRLAGSLKENLYRLLLLHGLFDCIRSFAQLLDELVCLIFLAHYLADLFDRAKHTFKIVRISNEDRNVLPVELLREYFELRCSRDEDHLRLQGDDSLEIRME